MKKTKMKGIAIRIQEDLLKQIEEQDTPRNDLITSAIETYLSKENGSSQVLETLSDDVYNELYSTMYTTELVPLRQRLAYQEEIITVLRDEIKEFKEDKTFLQEYIIKSMEKKKGFFSKKK